MCSSIIEQETFDSSSSNYAESDVRSWLITEFYNTAFNQLQQELILITKVNNGLESAGSTLDKFTGDDTYDKIFLLSYEEVTNELYGFAPASTTEDSARRLFGSDYTRAKGNYVNTGSSYYGTGQWWLRSPSISATHAQLISTGGTIGNGIIDT